MENKKFNHEGIDITIEKSEVSPIVEILTNDADIYVNGVLVWQRFEEEEYRCVPPILRDFLQENNPFFENDVENQTLLAEFDICNENISFFIPYNAIKPISARIALISSMDELESEYIRNMSNIDDVDADRIVVELKSIWKRLEDRMEQSNFKLIYSHSMGEAFYAWWDIVFTLDNWNEDNFKKTIEIVREFNEKLSEYDKKYKF